MIVLGGDFRVVKSDHSI